MDRLTALSIYMSMYAIEAARAGLDLGARYMQRAREWMEAGASAADAVTWERHGLTPDRAARLIALDIDPDAWRVGDCERCGADDIGAACHACGWRPAAAAANPTGDYTVALADEDMARQLAAMPQLAANGHRVDITGADATLSAAALAVLADLPDDYDGHYDGTSIWVGGLPYQARPETYVI